MATVIFVHGTGVREPSYIETFNQIREAMAAYGVDYRLNECMWGKYFGSKPPVDSLPDTHLETQPQEFTQEREFARWELLYDDPLFELRLLQNRPVKVTPVPADKRADFLLWNRIRAYQPSEEFLALLKQAKLNEYWAAAWEGVIGSSKPAQEASIAYGVLHSSFNDIGEPGQAIARALVAWMTVLALDAGRTLIAGHRRDALVFRLVDDWEARVAGIGALLMKFLTGTAEVLATPLLKRRRAKWSEGAAPGSGDVMLYQVRGENIRNYIEKQIHAAEDDVILLAHSLGGIACVDLLASKQIPAVTHLITAGSQSPLLYEINALWSLDSDKEEKLPGHFPPWLNLFDPYDFLSYVAKPVFKRENIVDKRIESGQPFPASHSAYWTNPATWKEIQTFLREHPDERHG